MNSHHVFTTYFLLVMSKNSKLAWENVLKRGKFVREGGHSFLLILKYLYVFIIFFSYSFLGKRCATFVNYGDKKVIEV